MLYLSTSHLNPAYSVNVTDFLGCTHTVGEGKLIFCLSMAWLTSVWSMGRLPEGNSRAFGVVGL